MKVNEIISEERLDEALPLIAGLAIPAILTAVSAFLTGLTIMEVYGLISKYNEDPESVTDDEWSNIFIDVALLAVPTIGKLGKPVFIKMIPNKIKVAGGRWMKNKVMARMRADRTAAGKKYGAGAQAGKSASQRRAMQASLKAAKDKAAARATANLKKIEGQAIYDSIGSYLGAGVAANLAFTYWNKIADIEEQIKLRNGDKATGTPENLETPLFGEMDLAAANNKARDLKQQALGELTVAVGSAIASKSVGKSIDMFNKWFGKILPNGTITRGLFQLPGNVASALVKIGGPGLAMFMQTDSGKKILEMQVVKLFTTTVGAVVDNAYDLILDTAKIVANSMGLDIGGAVDKLKSNIKQPSELDAPGGVASHPDPHGLAITTDPKNPKIKMIGGNVVTGPDGYVLNTIPRLVSSIREKAAAYKVADPFDQLKFDPNKQYTNY